MRTFKSLSNVRNSRLTSLERIVASTVEGGFKITPKAAEKLGLSEGLMVQLVVDGDQVFIAKGKGEPTRNEDGSFVTDGRGRKQYEGETLGSTVSSNANSQLLMASNTAAWNTLGGSKDYSIEFELGEGEEGMVLINPQGNPNDPSNQFVGTFYELKEVERRAKSSSSDEDEDEQPTTETVVPDTNDGFEAEEI